MLWGAFGVTLFGIFLTPVFFYVVDWLTNRRQVETAAAPAETSPDVALVGEGA